LSVTGLRERKKQQARESIVDAALDLFAEHGFEATTVQAIADRAGVSPATVARYFPTKDSLLLSERDTRIAQLRTAILGRPRRESPLRALVAALADEPAVTEPFRGRLLRSRRAIASSPVLRGRALGLLDEWRDGIADALVERGAEALEAHVTATAVVAVFDDAAARWATAGGRTDLTAEVRQSLSILLPGR
jgi:AcrR family transcriptional regulator